MFAALLSSNACGRHSKRSRLARRCPMLKLRDASVRRRPSVRSQELAPRTILPSRFLAIVSFAAMVRSLAMLGASNASAFWSTAKLHKTRDVAPQLLPTKLQLTRGFRDKVCERRESLRVFGRLPYSGARGCTEAGVGKASKEETAGSFAPAVVSAMGI